MMTLDTDICIIGAGSGGLSVAAGASQMGASTVLIEKGKMGGDCLNYGCVPSKSLLAAGHVAEGIREGHRYGVTADGPRVDGAAVHKHVHGVIGAIAPNDSVERFEGLGVKVIQAAARFVDDRHVEADGVRVRARRFVVATGSSPAIPPVPGLDAVPYLTNENIFDLTSVPDHLVVVGGGPIGIEMAQAHRHLGARVTVLQRSAIMPKDDPELVDIVRTRLIEDGIEVLEGTKIVRIDEKPGGGVAVTVAGREATGDGNGAAERVIEGSHLLVAVGRQASVDGLDLDKAGIEFSPKGIRVDSGLRTTNRRVYAIGDVAGGYQFTHVAGYHAGVVIKNALFRIPSKEDTRTVPWVTYTTPELAQVGMVESQAKERHGDIRILRWPFHENDRAQAERDTDGLVKVVATPKGHILGAGIVGKSAGELLHVWVLAMSQKLKVGAVATMIAPYPTLGEVNKRAAGSFYTPKLFSDRTRKIVRFLSRFG